MDDGVELKPVTADDFCAEELVDETSGDDDREAEDDPERPPTTAVPEAADVVEIVVMSVVAVEIEAVMVLDSTVSVM